MHRYSIRTTLCSHQSDVDDSGLNIVANPRALAIGISNVAQNRSWIGLKGSPHRWSASDGCCEIIAQYLTRSCDDHHINLRPKYLISVFPVAQSEP